MHASLAKLLELGGDALAPGNPSLEMQGSSVGKQTMDALNELYLQKNGFLAFESALYVFPVQSNGDHIGIVDWNVSDTWKYAYGGMADTVFSFAQDIFGNQFGISGDRVVAFNCETGAITDCAQSIGDWADLILRDYDFLTGHSVARSWQAINGGLFGRMRLFPKRPFTIGGSYEHSNLTALQGEKLLEFFGDFSRQIRDMPDGSNIRLVVPS